MVLCACYCMLFVHLNACAYFNVRTWFTLIDFVVFVWARCEMFMIQLCNFNLYVLFMRRSVRSVWFQFVCFGLVVCEEDGLNWIRSFRSFFSAVYVAGVRCCIV